MTLPEQLTRYVFDGPYEIGDTAPIPFSYDEPADVRVFKGTTPLVLNIDFTVLRQNITLQTPIGSEERLVLMRQTPLSNEAEFPQEADFNSEKINDSFDKVTMQVQELADKLDRVVLFPVDTPSSIQGIAMPLPAPGKVPAWNEDGTALVNKDIDPGSLSDRVGNLEVSVGNLSGRVTQNANSIVSLTDTQNILSGDITVILGRLGGLTLVGTTKAAYDEMSSHDPNTIYFCTE